MKDYPNLSPDSPEDQKIFMRYVLKERRNDINDFSNLKNVFILGRKSAKIPTGASDVDPVMDRVGDINFTDTFMYVLIDNSGTAEWRRAALSTF